MSALREMNALALADLHSCYIFDCLDALDGWLAWVNSWRRTYSFDGEHVLSCA